MTDGRRLDIQNCPSYTERKNHAKTRKNERDHGRDWQSESRCSCCAGNSRWQGEGIIDKKDFSLFYSGPKERTGRYGTGFIINAKIRKSFISFEPLSDRLCKMRSRGKFRNITVTSAYAPTENSPDAIKDKCYDQLSQEYEKTHKYDILILLGILMQKLAEKSS